MVSWQTGQPVDTPIFFSFLFLSGSQERKGMAQCPVPSVQSPHWLSGQRRDGHVTQESLSTRFKVAPCGAALLILASSTGHNIVPRVLLLAPQRWVSVTGGLDSGIFRIPSRKDIIQIPPLFKIEKNDLCILYKIYLLSFTVWFSPLCFPACICPRDNRNSVFNNHGFVLNSL